MNECRTGTPVFNLYPVRGDKSYPVTEVTLRQKLPCEAVTEVTRR